jgi:hypothetical protein
MGTKLALAWSTSHIDRLRTPLDDQSLVAWAAQEEAIIR